MTCQHLAHELGVQRRGGLVEEQQLRAQGEGTHDADALLLAAGELERVAVLLAGQADAGQQVPGLLDRLRLGPLLHLDRALDHVLQDGLVREEVVVLEHHGAAVPQGQHLLLRHRRGKVHGQFPREFGDAGVGDFEAVQAAQHRRLS